MFCSLACTVHNTMIKGHTALLYLTIDNVHYIQLRMSILLTISPNLSKHSPVPRLSDFFNVCTRKEGELVSEVMHVQTWATKTTSIFKSNKLPELTEKNKGGITVNSSIHAFLDHSG